VNAGPVTFPIALELMARRSLSHWRLLSAVVVGVVLAGAIMATSVLFFESLRDLALQRALEQHDPGRLDILIDARDAPLSDERHDAVTGIVESTVLRHLSPFLKSHSSGLKSWTFYIGDGIDLQKLTGLCNCDGTALSGPTETIEVADRDGNVTRLCDCRRAFFGTHETLDDHIEMIRGRRPGPTVPPVGEDTLHVEVMVPVSTAEAFGLDAGSSLRVVPHWEDVNDDVVTEVTGVYERADPTSEFWHAYDEAFGTISRALVFAEFIVPRVTLVKVLGPYLPKMGAQYTWRLDVDNERLHAEGSESVRQAIAQVDTEMRAEVDGYRQETQLPQVLAGFETELFFNRLPMFIVLILIVVVVLYYVLTLASLLIDAQREEISLLRSRGATSVQMLAVYAVEAAGLAVLAIALGPVMAAGAVKLIGVVPWFEELSSSGGLSVRLSANVYRMAAAGAGLSFLALVVPAARAARRDVVAQRRIAARPPSLPVFQKYYLDLGLLAIVVFLFWQLSRQGSFVAVRLFGEEAVDQLVLAVPAIMLVAVALVLLRVFPASMDFLGRALSSRHLRGVVPPAFVLGLWQMARNPAHHARLSLLLILTAGLGVFAASFGATLERSAQDQLLYASGADARVTGIEMPTNGISRTGLAEIAELDEVEAVTPVLRKRGYGEAIGAGGEFEVLAVRPEEFAEVASWRPDLAGGELPRVLNRIDLPGDSGMALPEDAHWLSVRIRPLASRPDVWLGARLRDNLGRFITLPIGSLAPRAASDLRFPCTAQLEDSDERPNWCRIGAMITGPEKIARVSQLLPQPPVTLLSLIVVAPYGQLAPGAVEIDDIAVTTRRGDDLIVVEDFDEPGRWHMLATTANAQGDALTGAADADGNRLPDVARFSWTRGDWGELRGFAVDDVEAPLRALASPSFLELFDVSVGDALPILVDGGSLNVRISGVADYFPTADPQEKPFLVVDLDALLFRANADRLVGDVQWNEMWIRSSTDDTYEIGTVDLSEPREPLITRSALELALAGQRMRFGAIEDRGIMVAGAQIDPLASAGWRALLVMAFGTVLLVSAIGFYVHAQVSFRAREGEFALLRTIGLSMRQLLALVVIEQVLVIGVAIGLGIFMGTRLGATIMPYLANSGQGGRILPPMVTEVDWSGFGATFGIVGAVFLLVVTAILVAVYRMSIHRVMRLGEG